MAITKKIKGFTVTVEPAEGNELSQCWVELDTMGCSLAALYQTGVIETADGTVGVIVDQSTIDAIVTFAEAHGY